jgi:hypothetical protein
MADRTRHQTRSHCAQRPATKQSGERPSVSWPVQPCPTRTTSPCDLRATWRLDFASPRPPARIEFDPRVCCQRFTMWLTPHVRLAGPLPGPMADRTRHQTRSHRARRRATNKVRRTAQRQLAGETVPDANDVPMRPACHMAPRFCFAAITGPPRIRPAGVRAAAGHQTVRRTAQRQLAGETVPDANDVPMRPACHMGPRFCFAATAGPH